MKQGRADMAPENVWEYPRPPRVEPCRHRVKVEFNGETLAESSRAYRVLETSHPPTYYIPKADIRMERLRPNRQRTYCEYKGAAEYWDIDDGATVSVAAAWSYPAPAQAYSVLRDHFAFYAQRVDACFVDEERVDPQNGDFYGGWITSHVTGPFKGGPGTTGW